MKVQLAIAAGLAMVCSGQYAAPAPFYATRPQAVPVGRPAVRPAARPVVRPAARPAVRPVARPAARPAVRPAARPVSVRPPVVAVAPRPVAPAPVSDEIRELQISYMGDLHSKWANEPILNGVPFGKDPTFAKGEKVASLFDYQGNMIFANQMSRSINEARRGGEASGLELEQMYAQYDSYQHLANANLPFLLGSKNDFADYAYFLSGMADLRDSEIGVQMTEQSYAKGDADWKDLESAYAYHRSSQGYNIANAMAAFGDSDDADDIGLIYWLTAEGDADQAKRDYWHAEQAYNKDPSADSRHALTTAALGVQAERALADGYFTDYVDFSDKFEGSLGENIGALKYYENEALSTEITRLELEHAGGAMPYSLASPYSYGGYGYGGPTPYSFYP